jgi:hypothetical protein
MIVMYWNCTCPMNQTNRFSIDKRDFIGKIVNGVKPDLLCLDEFSEQVNDNASAGGFAVNHLDGKYEGKAVVINPGTHLNSVTFLSKKTEFAFQYIETGVPKEKWASDDTKRDLTKCRYKAGIKEITIWFLHANASKKNGRKAANFAARTVDNKYQAFIGDFNCPIGQVNNYTVEPGLRREFRFTQWNVDPFGKKRFPETIQGKNMIHTTSSLSQLLTTERSVLSQILFSAF